MGRRGAYGAVAINWTPRESGAPSRLGIITTRRLGPAVTRSRARRLIREAFRVLKNDLSEPLDLVVIARRSIVDASASRVASDLQRLFNRQGLLARNPPNSHLGSKARVANP